MRTAVIACVAAALLTATNVGAQTIYTTTFTSGTTFVPTYQAGNFSATFAGPALSYFSEYYAADDPCIRNIGPGLLSLTFNQPVLALSFDVGGLDASWGDQVTFSMAPTSPLGATLNRNFYFTQNVPTLSGSSLIPTGSGCGARVSFDNLGGGAGTTAFSFVWSDNGTAGGNDWVLYDNFSFTVVPEPSAFALVGFGGVVLLISGRRKQGVFPKAINWESERPREA